jgi:mRNA interferase YafQ
MRELVLLPGFERAFRKIIRKNPDLQSQIETTLRRMAENLNDPRLKTHRLSGQLAGLHACSVAYDCRIVFSKQKKSQNGWGNIAAHQHRNARRGVLKSVGPLAVILPPARRGCP